jgi:hypothetical protein
MESKKVSEDEKKCDEEPNDFVPDFEGLNVKGIGFGGEERKDPGETPAIAIEEFVFESHLDALISYCDTRKFLDPLDAFKEENSQPFVSWDLEGEKEHPLAFMVIFIAYQALLETLLQDFATARDMDSKELYFQCRDALDGQFTALFEEHRHKWFVDLLFEWQEYEVFVESMLVVARKKSNRTTRK